jgi:ribose transport system substrate-binding protein
MVAIVVALAVTSAGSAGRSATPLQQAQAALKVALTLPKSIGLKKSAKPIPTGKRIVYVHCGVPACTIIADAINRAAKVLGWKYQTLSTDGTPESVKNAWKTAVRMKPDAVLSSGYDKALYATELAQLKKLGIGVYNYATLDKPGGGIRLMIGGPKDVEPAGWQMAAYIVSDTKGKANVLYVDLPSFTILQPVGKAFKRDYAKWCPGCPIDTMDMPVTALGKDAPDKIVSYLRAHPDVNYVAFSYDGASLGLPAALKAAGIAGKVKFVGEAPSVENLGYVASGGEAATVSQGYYEIWANVVDAVARDLTGQSIKGNQSWKIPYFLQTKSNLKSSTGFAPVVPNLYGQLKQLWLKK